MSRLKYALIGYGRRGRSHIETAATLKETFEVAFTAGSVGGGGV